MSRNQYDEINYQIENWLNEKKELLEEIERLKIKCNEMEERKKEETIVINEKIDNHIKN
jgi:predicted nuclease with TOPRIM domain